MQAAGVYGVISSCMLMSMRRILALGPLLLVATLCGQQPDTLQTTSTLVLVPTLVQASSGADLVHALTVKDFVVTDNGVPQQLHLEEATLEPLAVVVLLQTGGAAPRQFANYAGIGTMLQNAFGSVRYHISLVTFDSQPEDRWSFTDDATRLQEAFLKPRPGDGGAAVLNAIEYGLDWFDDQHPGGRRLILLISDEHFHAGHDALRHTTQRLTETNTTIYSLSFNPEKTWLKDEFVHGSPENPPLFFAPDHPAIVHTFNLDRPLRMALGAMQTNAAQGVAALSGGTYMPFNNRGDLEQQLLGLANDLSNRYILSFEPSNSSQGLHSLQVTLPKHPELHITARSAYWNAAAKP